MSFLVKNKGKIMEKIWPSIQELIDQLCAEFDKVWQKRQRVIDTKFLVTFITKLVLSKNKQGLYNSRNSRNSIHSYDLLGPLVTF